MIRNVIKNQIKKIIMGQRLRRRSLLSPFLIEIMKESKLICVDVGAALGLIEQWEAIDRAGEFYLIEPGRDAAQDLRIKFKNQKNYHVVEKALSASGGQRALHITNVPTGSSILDFNEDLVGRYVDPDYLFPIKDIEINTITLDAAMEQVSVKSIDLMKIDVQGAEFEVLKGLGVKRLESLACVEFEYNMHNAYLGQGEFSEIQNFLKKHGLELFDIRIARTHGLLNKRPVDASYLNVFPNSRSVSARVWELDLVFFRNPESIFHKSDGRGLRALIAAYCIYGFYLDALRVCDDMRASHILGIDEIQNIKATVVEAHRVTSCRWYDRPNFFTALGRNILSLCGVGPNWYRIQYSHVALPNS